MKTLMTALLALAIQVGTFASPNEKPLAEVTMVESQNQKFKVHLLEGVGRVQISILNQKGKLVDKTSFKIDEPSVIPFNISQLPEGNYTVKVETKMEEIAFEVSAKKPVQKKLLAYANVKNDNTVNLKVVGIENPGIKVTFYDQSHRRITSDHVDVAGGFSKDYILKNRKLKEVYMEVIDQKGKSKIFYFD
ncbi:flagellar hook assembly protein FlgD [Pleomorphovibrio marinus]|uniref:hypothetical protein n=1 Tax=Pleomorphovibrio marinus TaxID=2164132 RepID=UPI00130077D2|nr:hypothetical protein [Pleomorphovibrio marinus]